MHPAPRPLTAARAAGPADPRVERRAALLATVIALVVACAAPAEPAATAGARGGTVVIAWQEPATLHPFYSAGTQTSALVYAVAVEGLVRTDPSGALVPVLASAVPTITSGAVQLLPGGGMTVRYALQPRLSWSDGESLTSRDVRFTWQAVMHDPLVASREGYELIDDVETPDDSTAIVRYREPYPGYATRFMALLPQHLLAGRDASKTDYVRRPMGSGPFVITEFVSGDHITAERNPRYRAAARPYLDRLIFRFLPSIDAAKAQLRTGEIDVAPSLGEGDVPDLQRDPAITIEHGPSPAVETLAFNLASPPSAPPAGPHPVLGDPQVRRALLRATPKTAIVERLLGGLARPGTSEIPIGWAAPAGLAQEGYDPAAAARSLEESGWPAGADGIRNRAGVRARLTVVSTTGNRLREQVEQLLVDEWRTIGVELVIRNVPNATLTGTWQSGGVRKRGEFDVLLAQTGLSFDAADPQSYLSQRRRCASIPRAENAGAGANYERFCDPRVDGLLDEAARTLDDGRRRELYAQVLALVDSAVPDVYLFDRARLDAHRADLVGLQANGWDVATWNVADWHRVGVHR